MARGGRGVIATITAAEDLHALAVQEALSTFDDIENHIVASDRIGGGTGVSWSSSTASGTLPSIDGQLLAVSEIDVVWWRRPHRPQALSEQMSDPFHVQVTNNDCTAALTGVLLNEFRGTWVNHPVATSTAQNKLFQLRAAQQAGFRVPRTLVSQDPFAIRAFFEDVQEQMVIKTVRGSIQAPLLARMVRRGDLSQETDEFLRVCPAIYQEYVPGTQHIRAHCFGDAVHATLIECDTLDWRANYDVPMREMEISDSLKNQLLQVLRTLGLEMGICDLKIATSGEPVWLEVNPQGQFLFVEGITGMKLSYLLARYLAMRATPRGASQHAHG